MIDYAEADISAKQSSSGEDSRISGAHGDQERSPGVEETPGEGAQAPHPVALLRPDRRLPEGTRLLKPAEFRVVYASGRRYDGRLLSVFVLPNELGRHRLGVTASRKISRRAVDRNRLKRLARESFRLSGEALAALSARYDWVINPRRALLDLKLDASLDDFQRLVARVGVDEQSVSAGAAREKF